MQKAIRFMFCAWLFSLLASLSFAQTASHAFLWSSTTGMQDLGTLGTGEDSEAFGINSAGHVVGDSNTNGPYTPHAFLWTQSGGMQDLGGHGGIGSIAFAINDHDQVVGMFHYGEAVMWMPDGTMRPLGSLGANGAGPAAINNSGEVVGVTSITGSQYTHAFRWTLSEGMQDLGTLGGNESGATGINDAGQIVGYSEIADGSLHAFIWTKSGGMKDLGIAGEPQTKATAINSSGMIVGYRGYDERALVWKGGTPHVFGTTESWSYAVNLFGQVVGAFDYGAGYHAFLWTKTGGMQDLGSLDGDSFATGINASGQVVGYFSLKTQ
jgi:probable HAF family extracellular repeat protein